MRWQMRGVFASSSKPRLVYEGLNNGHHASRSHPAADHDPRDDAAGYSSSASSRSPTSVAHPQDKVTPAPPCP